MDSIQHKLDEFTKTFLTESSENASAIIQNILDDREARLAQAKEEIAAEVRAYKRGRIREIRTREGSRVSAQVLENKRGLFTYRQRCAEEVRAQVLERIRVFTASAEYGGHLQSLLERALEVLGREAPVTVLLREADMGYRDDLTSGGVDVDFAVGEFSLGGLRVSCPAKSLCVDLTFDEALDDALGHFAEFSGIDLEQA